MYYVVLSVHNIPCFLSAWMLFHIHSEVDIGPGCLLLTLSVLLIFFANAWIKMIYIFYCFLRYPKIYKNTDKKLKMKKSLKWINESLNWIPQNEIDRPSGPNRLLRTTFLNLNAQVRNPLHNIWNRKYVHDFVYVLMK